MDIAKGLAWNQGAVEDVIAEAQARLELAARYFHKQVKKNISIETAAVGPSKPGEFIHLDSGETHDTLVLQKISPNEWIVGSNTIQGAVHEFGDRPWLRRTMFEEWSHLVQIVGSPISGELQHVPEGDSN
jgi:phage gpG-like protein